MKRYFKSNIVNFSTAEVRKDFSEKVNNYFHKNYSKVVAKNVRDAQLFDGLMNFSKDQGSNKVKQALINAGIITAGAAIPAGAAAAIVKQQGIEIKKDVNGEWTVSDSDARRIQNELIQQRHDNFEQLNKSKGELNSTKAEHGRVLNELEDVYSKPGVKTSVKIEKGVEDGIDSTTKAIKSTGETLKSLPGKLEENIENTGRQMQEDAPSVGWKAERDYYKRGEFVENLPDNTKQLAHNVGQGMKDTYNSAKEGMKDTYNSAKEGISNTIDSVKDSAQHAYDNRGHREITNAFEDEGNSIYNEFFSTGEGGGKIRQALKNAGLAAAGASIPVGVIAAMLRQQGVSITRDANGEPIIADADVRRVHDMLSQGNKQISDETNSINHKVDQGRQLNERGQQMIDEGKDSVAYKANVGAEKAIDWTKEKGGDFLDTLKDKASDIEGWAKDTFGGDN